MPGTIRFIEDVALADSAVEVTAPTLNELFETAALAVTQVMADPAKVRPQTPIKVELEESDLTSLLARFLSEIVFHKDADLWLFGSFNVDIREGPSGYYLKSTLTGEAIDPARHDLRSDVKAVTYHRLSVGRDGDRWTATFVLDI